MLKILVVLFVACKNLLADNYLKRFAKDPIIQQEEIFDRTKLISVKDPEKETEDDENNDASMDKNASSFKRNRNERNKEELSADDIIPYIKDAKIEFPKEPKNNDNFNINLVRKIQK